MQPADYFIVGGPVQADRDCYVVRTADTELAESIAAQRFSYVLGPRSLGKSSLMARSIKSLRHAGQAAALVDLSHIGARGDGSDPARWYYSIAYRILRELRLKLDLQSWWQENGALPAEQRFTEFFTELVLAHTSESVTVFFDEIEQTRDLPFARHFFSALRSCYARRVSEPALERLNFVALGEAAERQLCPDPAVSPFADGRRIRLDDFSLQETLTLRDGFGEPREHAERLLTQIHAWTHGQPYLTQKLARGVVRRGGRLADVERAVRQQLLDGGAAQSEALLVHVRARLTAPGPNMRRALVCLGRIAAGADVVDEPGAAYRDRLWLAGVVRANEDGRLEYRNRVFAQVFDAAWVRRVLPFDWRRPATIAAAVAVTTALAVWYAQYVPAPHVERLTSPAVSLDGLDDAHRRLRSLPFYGATADQLLADALAERSRAAVDFEAAREFDARLRALPDGDRRADRLLGEYWLRRAGTAAHAERRDAALLLTMAATALLPERARAVGAELIGSDYRRLERTLRLANAPVSWQADWQRGELTLIDPSHRVERIALDTVAAAPAAAPSQTRLTAVQQVPVARELEVGAAGAVGALSLLLDVRHGRASDLLVRLTAPSGAEATLPVPEARGAGQTLRLSVADAPALDALADQARAGLWQLSIVDRRVGQVGELVEWGLAFDDSRVWSDRLESPAVLPDPVRTEQVEIDLSRDGSVALVRPTRAEGSGALAVWDVDSGTLVNDFDFRTPPTSARLTRDARRLVVASARALTIRDVREGGEVARFEAAAGFSLPPAFDADERHVAIAERVDAQVPRFRLVALDDGRTLATANGLAGVRAWAVGGAAEYVALTGPGRTVRIMDLPGGRIRAELRHQRSVARAIPLPSNPERVVTVDAAGDIFVWSIAGDAGELLPSDGRHVATTSDPASVSVAAAADVVAFVTPRDHAVVRDLDDRFGANRFRIDAADDAVVTELTPDASRLLTVSGRVLRLWSVDMSAPASAPMRQLSAVAIDAGGRLAALGYDGGHVRVHETGDTIAPGGTGIDYIGHRGAVTALDIRAADGIAASGGSDGVVRIWELADAAPTDAFLRHPEGPVHAVRISADGRLIASAAEYSARIWDAVDGELVGEVPVNGAAGAIAFSADSFAIAVGDSAGNLFFGAPTGVAPLASARTAAGVTAVAYAPGGAALASGDQSGQIRFWDVATATETAPALVLRHPIAWLEYAAAGVLYAQSGDWLHRIELGDTAAIVTATRLLPLALEAGSGPALGEDGRLRFVGIWQAGHGPRYLDIAMDEPAAEPLPEDSALLTRDWSRVLGLELAPASGEVRERR